MMLPESYYEQLEQELNEILQLTKFVLTKEDIEDVIDKIENREYGIAIQSLGYVLIKKNLSISEQAVCLINNVIETMGMKDENDDDYWFWLEMQKYFS
ncbi:MAG: hypothetical protein QX189_12025 [Methylococcales bacterium]